MQIIVDISRGIFDLLQSGRLQNGSIGARTILNAISKGILLPERYGDLIRKSCDNCKHKDKKYKEFPCIDCLEKDRYEEDERIREAIKSINNYIESISQKAITISDGATNGDVIKMLFPNDSRDFLIVNMDKNDWWNAPYERGKE